MQKNADNRKFKCDVAWAPVRVGDFGSPEAVRSDMSKECGEISMKTLYDSMIFYPYRIFK